VVLRLGRNAVPVVDPRDIRRGLRPRAASWAANISAKRRVPYGSLILMIVPSIVISAVWAYKPDFQAVFLDATAVLL